MDNDGIGEPRSDRGMPRGAPSNRPLLPLDTQDAYRDRYRAMRPGWRSSGEQLEALVRSHLTPQSHVLDLGCGRGGVVELFWRCLLYTSPSPRDRQKSRM